MADLQTLLQLGRDLIIAIGNLVTTQQTTSTSQDNLTQQMSQNLATAGPQKPKVKTEPPAIFTGEISRGKSFIKELKAYFFSARITDLDDKIICALSRIRGDKTGATTWADGIQDQFIDRKEEIERVTAILNGPANHIPTPHPVVPAPYFSNWQEFEDMFLKHFGLLKSREEAIEMLNSLEQGNTTLEEYCMAFNTYFPRTKYGDSAGLTFFKKGMNKRLLSELMRARPKPADNADGTINLFNWQELASELDKTWRIEQREMSHYRPERKSPPAHTSPAYQPRQETMQNAEPAKDPNAMDIDKTRRSGYRRQNNGKVICFHCQKEGHFARDCPDKSKPKKYPPRGTRICALWADANEEEREALKKDLGF